MKIQKKEAMTIFSFRLTTDLLKKVRKIASKKKVSAAEVVRNLLLSSLKK